MNKHQAHLLHQQHKEYVQHKHSAMAGAVWDDKLKKMASYKKLVNHRKTSSTTNGPEEVKMNLAVCFKGFHQMVLMVSMY